MSRRRTPAPCPFCGGRSRDGHLCPACTSNTERRLRDLPSLWVTLQEQITRQTRMPAASRSIDAPKPPPEPRRVKRSPWAELPPYLGEVGRPLPYDASAATVGDRVVRGVTTRDAVRSGLVGWVRLTITDHGAPCPSDRIKALCEHLADWLPVLRKRSDAAEFADDVWAWIDAITNAVDLTRIPGRASLGPCPASLEGEPCSGIVWALLPREVDSTDLSTTPPPFARCDTCTTEWPSIEFGSLAQAMARRAEAHDRARRLAAEVIAREAVKRL